MFARGISASSLASLFLSGTVGVLGCQASIDDSGDGETSGNSSGASANTAGGGSGSPGSGGSAAAGGSGGSGTPQGGGVGTGATANSGGTGAAATTGGVTSGCASPGSAVNVGQSRLRRLTRTEFNHTVRDLLGATGTPADSIAPDERIGPFYSNAIAPITDLLVQQHDEVGDALATAAVARMATLSPCDLNNDAANSCAQRFVEEFGKKAYRRPLSTTERDALVRLYTNEKTQGGVNSAFVLLVSTFLKSPFFLYHAESGALGAASNAPVALTGYEIASRLSYFLWNTMPDAALFAAADNASLADPGVIASQVTRMLADPKAADAIPAFHLQWLGIGDMDGVEKDAARFPLYNPALLTAMRNETAAFSDFVVRKGDGLLGTLFTANFSFPDATLLPLYGMAAPAGFAPGSQVMLNAAERSGILTQPAFLARHAHRDQTSPVHRGILVRENILCQPLNPPPANVNNVAPAVTATQTTRQRFAAHEADPSCAGCHLLIDPIGLGFENYDAVGSYRTTEANQPIDASGEVLGGGADVAGPFVGAIELSQKLAKSQLAAECVANQWFRFALGRMESADDACTMQAIHDAFIASGGNVRSLLSSIAASDAFRHVRTGAGTP